ILTIRRGQEAGGNRLIVPPIARACIGANANICALGADFEAICYAALLIEPFWRVAHPFFGRGQMAARIDEDRLNMFVGKMLGDLGGGMSVPTVRLGLRLGLFYALAGGAATATELALRAGSRHESYVREWALAPAACVYTDSAA